MRSSTLRRFASSVIVVLAFAGTLPVSAQDEPPRVVSVSPKPDASGQLWSAHQWGVPEVSLVFSESVVIPADAVTAWTVNRGAIRPASSVYDDVTNTLTLGFSPALEQDRITIVVDYSIVDDAGKALDGEIGDPLRPLLPSGDTRPGGLAVFRLSVLQGDVNRDGIVDESDSAALLEALGTCDGDAAHDPLADLNDDGCVNVLDVSIHLGGLGGMLPAIPAIGPSVTSLQREREGGLGEDLTAVAVTFSDAIDPLSFSRRTCYASTSTEAPFVPVSGVLAGDGLSATYTFRPPLPQCESYLVSISNVLAGTSGALLESFTPADLSGLLPPEAPIIDTVPALVSGDTITVTGTLDRSATGVQVTTAAGTVIAPAGRGAFKAEAPLQGDAVNTIYVSTISDCDVVGPPATVQTIVDNQPPTVSILFPPDGLVVTNSSLAVTGNVGDPLSGAFGLSVSVNGMVAIVDPGIGTNGTFALLDLPLALGDNLIEVVAADALDNTTTTSVTVAREDVAKGTPTMTAVSGELQTSLVGTTLANPLVVELLDAEGLPLANKVVTFRVTRSDGRLATERGARSMAPDALSLQTLTDSGGLASASWTLGSDAGPGNNRVEVGALGVSGTVFFCASATPGAASRIVVGANDNQRARAGAAVPLPLVVRVLDGRNPVAGEPVTFSVVAGDGLVNGRSEVVVVSDAFGSAQVDLTLGPIAGVNRVKADIAGNTSRPAVFTALGVEAPGPGETTFTGLVLDNGLRGLGGAECAGLTVAGTSYGPVLTDVDGRFMLAGIDGPGAGDLFVDGSTATTLGGETIPTGTFPSLHFENFVVVANTQNSLPRPIMLPELMSANARTYSTSAQTILEVAGLDGLRMIVEPGSMTLPDGRPAPDGTAISLNQVHFDEIPMPLPDGILSPFAWTLQPGGASFDPPIRIELPNLTGLPPGAVSYFLSFNHATGRFDVVGTGSVTVDGALAVSDEGSGISIAGWGGFSGDPSPQCAFKYADAVVRDPAVVSQIQLDRAESNDPSCTSGSGGTCPPGLDPAAFHEEAGWVILDADGNLRVQNDTDIPACALTGCQSNPSSPTPADGEFLLARYHVHPEGRDADGQLYWTQAPSQGDLTSLSAYPAFFEASGIDPSMFVGAFMFSSEGVFYYDLDQTVYRVHESTFWDLGASPSPAHPGPDPPDPLEDLVWIVQPWGSPALEYKDAVLDNRAAASVLGVSATVESAGRFEVDNIPVTGGPMRVMIEATRPGEPLFAASDFFTPEADEVIEIEQPLLLCPDAIIVPIELTPAAPAILLEPGGSIALPVTGLMSDGSSRSLTEPSDGTWYQSTNDGTVTVSDSGLITATDVGTVFVIVSNQGVSATKRVDVTSEIVSTTIAGFVLFDDQTPAVDAVVGTPLGGQAVTGDDGAFTLSIDVPSEAETILVSAVATIKGVHYTGGTLAGPVVPGGFTDAGIIIVSTGGGTPTCEDVAWVPTFGEAPGVGGFDPVTAFATFDDGSGRGAALYVGGEFPSAGGVSANRVARWDGSAFSALGAGMTGADDDTDDVAVLAAFDDGSGPALFAGGSFTEAGGIAADHIARWDGSSWSALGSGTDGLVSALTVFDDGSGGGEALYVGGDFTVAGGVRVNGIARWDGTAWSPVGTGLNSRVMSLGVFDDGGGPALYVGGTFTEAGGMTVNSIAKWDGRSWSALGTGMTSFVSALTVFDDGGGSALYAGGAFATAGGEPALRIARWDGTSWSALGTGMNNVVYSLAVFDDGGGGGPRLIAGGLFSTADGLTVNQIAAWDGAAWSDLDGGMTDTVCALTVFDDGDGPRLIAGGDFDTAGSAAVNRVASWDGAAWSPLGGSGLSRYANALAGFDDGSGSGQQLHVGGEFDGAGGQTVSRIAKWDGAAWSPLGTGMSGDVDALVVHNDGSGAGPSLYAGGGFLTAGGLTVNRIARWNGSAWSGLGTGMSSTVKALTVFDDGDGEGPALFAGGGFSSAGGVTARRVAKWDGAAWSPLGDGMSLSVFALTGFDDGFGGGPALYAGGVFVAADNMTVNRIAKWDGTSWSALGTGVSSTVYALIVHDDGSGPALYVGGLFTDASGIPVNYIARWDGATWSPLEDGLDGAVKALAVFDDGGGPALYAGGDFTTVGGVSAGNIARWDGSTWSALGAGVSSRTEALMAFDDGLGFGTALYAGGTFEITPVGDSYLAKWGCGPQEVAAPPPASAPRSRPVAQLQLAPRAGREASTPGRRLRAGETLEIGTGLSRFGALTVPAGATLRLTQAASRLSVHALNVEPGGTLVWQAGTIEITGGVWRHFEPVAIGCARAATLRLMNDAMIEADGVHVCPTGTLVGDGTITGHLLNEGVVAPTGPGIEVRQSMTQRPAGRLMVRPPASGHDEAVDARLRVDGPASLAGAASFAGVAGTPDGCAGEFRLLSADRVDGTLIVSVPEGDRCRLTAWIETTGTFVTAGLTRSRPADVDCDGFVNLEDVVALLTAWGPCEAECCPEDVAPEGGDGLVNAEDLRAVIGQLDRPGS